MNCRQVKVFSTVRSMVVFLLWALSGIAAAQGFTLSPNDTLTSIVINNNNSITFSVYAPAAKSVKLAGPDIPEDMKNLSVRKSDNGVWEMNTRPLEPGAYRYEFIIDDTHVMDPRNPITSQSNMNSWSLLYLPGAAFMDAADVPHGSLCEVTYYSKVLKKLRRMHVYLPPGYEKGSDSYPVFYLMHGAFDCDDSWSTVGRAGYIIDNLLAGKKIVPMVVVMPAGHTGPFSFSNPRDRDRLGRDEFIDEFNQDILPYVESNYRVKADRQHRAIAGLSMGGAHALNIAFPRLADFAYIGVFSSGIFGIVGPVQPPKGESWEEKNTAVLDDAKLKTELKLVWFGIGREDFLLETAKATVAMLKKHAFGVEYKESGGGHTWKNWREYLNEFSQKLFK